MKHHQRHNSFRAHFGQAAMGILCNTFGIINVIIGDDVAALKEEEEIIFLRPFRAASSERPFLLNNGK